jgi:hypothetical protein
MSPLGRRHRHHLKNEAAAQAVRLEVFGDGDLELICRYVGPPSYKLVYNPI